jgi:hypothetical protein
MVAFFEQIQRPKTFSFWWPEHDGMKGSDMSEQWVAPA